MDGKEKDFLFFVKETTDEELFDYALLVLLTLKEFFLVIFYVFTLFFFPEFYRYCILVY